MPEQRPDRTLGGPHDEFWAWCAEGELRLQCCARCGEIAWPVVEACETCGGEDFAWSPMSGRGKIASWCAFERDYYAGVLPIPWNVIVVELEEGPLFLSNPKGFGWTEAKVGMPVSLDFVDCEDSAGTYRLPVFQRAG